MPWAAFAFTTLYLQLQGWSDAAASTMLAMFSASDAVGAFLGGVVGDWAAARYPNHGRWAFWALHETCSVVPFSLKCSIILHIKDDSKLVKVYPVAQQHCLQVSDTEG